MLAPAGRLRMTSMLDVRLELLPSAPRPLKQRARVRLHHGTADHSVPTIFSYYLAEEARAAGKTAELYVYDGDDHNLATYFTAAMLRSIAFFDQYVKGDE